MNEDEKMPTSILKKAVKKEMVYGKKRLEIPEVLAEGKWKEWAFLVLNMGTHPCAYVRIPQGNLIGRKDYEMVNRVFEEKQLDPPHGWFTFGETFEKDDPQCVVFKEGAWLGWDYGHFQDYIGGLSTAENGAKHSTIEMVAECLITIDELRGIEPEDFEDE